MRTPVRLPLILRPTPLHRMDHASRLLGIDLWIKRDDLTGFAMGGNKGRKLEYLIADAIVSGADTLVSCGSAQSNFVRQLAAACAVRGLKCAAAVMSLPFPDGGAAPEGPRTNTNGNLLLDGIFGADVRLYDDGSWSDLFQAAEELAQELEAQGHVVYRVPIGGSSALGAFAFFRAASEVSRRGIFDSIVTASSSGSTHAGLAYAFHGSATRVVGISCDAEDILDDVERLIGDLDDLTGLDRNVAARYLDLRSEFVGAGYGVPTKESLDAIVWLAQVEGILLDPVYSGKAFAGLMALAEQRQLRGRVLFWHTGGVPALFSYDPLIYVGAGTTL